MGAGRRRRTVGLPTDRPARVLLLVHGTFSSTVGAFGAMAVWPGAEGFVATVLSAYDAVIGYDHRTLSVDPKQNARDLLDVLRPHPGTDRRSTSSPTAAVGS